MILWPEKRWAKAMVVLGYLVVLMVLLHLPIPQKIKIGPDTTVIDGPLNPDGTVNYVEALNAIAAKGVTAENNAAPLLLEALGPKVIDETVRDKVLNRLGIHLEPNAPGRFVSWANRTQRQTPTTTSCPSQPAESVEVIAAKKVEDLPQETTTQPKEESTEDAACPKDTGPDEHDIMDMLAKGQVHPDLDPWLKENAKSLDLVTQACQRPRLYIPLASPSDLPMCIDACLNTYASLREVAKALMVRSRYRCTQGNLAGAWADVLSMHRLARLIGQGPLLIEYLIALAVEGLPGSEGCYLATHGVLSTEEARLILKDLNSLGPVGDPSRCIDQADRFIELDFVMKLYAGHLPTEIPGGGSAEFLLRTQRSSLDWNRMLRITNRRYDRIVEVLRQPSSEKRRNAARALDRDIQAMDGVHSKSGEVARIVGLWIVGWPLRGTFTDTVTNQMLSTLRSSQETLIDLTEMSVQWDDLERLSIAMAGFRAQTGRWPRELGELVPAFLEAIPPDRFSGKALIYKPTEKGYTLYGVGMNGRDDGGRLDPNMDNDTYSDDIVVSVE